MRTDQYFDKPPIVVGGVGGSGTRVVAAALKKVGIFIGDDLNGALDNMLTRSVYSGTRERLKSFSMNRCSYGLASSDYILNYDEEIKNFFQEGMDKFEREMFAAFNSQKLRTVAWGWKGPPSFNFLELFKDYFGDLRYIHVMRHGVDMAFSNNQNQLLNWGWRYGLPPSTDPANSFKYWVCANRQALFDAKRLGINFHVVNFDHLCADPTLSFSQMLNFIDITFDPADLIHLVQRPNSSGRRFKNECNFVDHIAQDALCEFGFDPN